ncbi:AT hook domain-containing protein [Xylaria flabelliformis]|nr:AT hook domain-containing protein [Xylaria flabelliformis]
MATSREERMQQRMRGAGRHEVADDSFGFVLPGAEASPDPSPSLPQIRSEPNTSAKRRRLDNDPESATSQPSSASTATRSSARLSSGQKPTPRDVVMRSGSPRSDSPPTTTKRISARLNTLNLNIASSPRDNGNDYTRGLPTVEATGGEPMDEDDEQLQELTPRRTLRGSRGSAASRLSQVSMMDYEEEVTESPVAAPGSGRRRRVEQIDAMTQSARLQRMVMAEEEAGATGEVATSSPLARKSRQSMATVGTLSTRTTRTTRASLRKTPSSPIEEIQESSPLARPSRKSDSVTPTGSARSVRSTRSQNHQHTPTILINDADELSSPPDAAGTVSPKKPQLRKRPAVILESPYEIGESEEENRQVEETVEPDIEPDIEPEIGPEVEVEAEAEVEVEAERGAEADDEEAEEVNDHEAARRIGRKRLRVSPRQKPQPDDADNINSSTASVERPAKKRRPKQNKVSPAKQAQPKPIKERKKPSARRKSDGESIPVTVQRYTKPLRQNDDDTDEDILNGDIPFTDHKSPNVVDVMLQICEESIEKYLSVLHEEASQAEGSANRKIHRTKLRAVEAFQEELRTRLQAQTIALDNLRTLKKRVRATQKEKVSLRNEILRIRAEREQVDLKIDAVRMRHETANQESLHQLGLSSTMDDIELAVENGKMAPELNPKEQKRAELANLDLLISQITNQVSVTGEGGGTLKQIKDFNMFLERVAVALEGR